ncbi:hypothetical protein F1880_007131 [Penicillium rolfsii]|nr:hypothetical protein F1880_007131 [Penicillium rolfsii]
MFAFHHDEPYYVCPEARFSKLEYPSEKTIYSITVVAPRSDINAVAAGGGRVLFWRYGPDLTAMQNISLGVPAIGCKVTAALSSN